MKITLKRLLEFVFPTDTFQEQCNKESSENYLTDLNKDTIIQVGQSWRAPLTESDKHCKPVFLEVVGIKEGIASCLSNYSKKVDEISFQDLKSKWVCVN